MRKRLLTFVACVGVQGAAWGLDAQSQKLADRYLTILIANPMQQTAFDRVWKIHVEAGEIEALVAACQQRAAQAPVLYARVLQRVGRTAEAKQVLAEAVQSGSGVATEMLAGVLEEEGDIRAAAEVVAKAPATEKSPSLLVRLGELLEKAGEAEQSRAAWNRAVALDPGDLALRKRLAAACAQTGNWQEAVDHLQVIARHGSPAERFDAWSEISQRLEAAGKIPETIAAQEALLGLMGPGHWQLDSARQRLLNLHDQNHSLDELEKTWRAQAEARPRDPQQALRMAKLYEFKGDDLQRHDWLSRASALLPKDVSLSCEIAALDLSLGNPQAAADRYDKALAMRPDDGDIIFWRAEVSALMEQEEDAEHRIEAYLAAHRDDEAATARAVEFYNRLHLTAPLERKLSAAFGAQPDNLEAACDLARFYLEQRRDAEAAACLSRFDASRLGSVEAAAASFRFAELLKGSEAKGEEIRWARRAVENDASRPEYALRLADLLQAEGQTEAMLDVLRRACEASDTSLPREDLDRRLFLALQTSKPAPSEERDGITRSPIDDMITLLGTQAQKSGRESPWLRLARWLRWADSRSSPISALHRGLGALPESVALQEALAVQLADSGDPLGAIEALTRLAELAPERTDEIQRRIGHLELDRGDTEEGLRIFQTLADRSKDWQAFADVALAQQMGGNWFDAFETWQRAYTLAPPDARRSLRSPILNATARLQLFTRGLDFLEEACAAEGGTPARKELFDEAGSYAVEHGVADDWRARLERRARSSPNDRLWRECLASLLTAEGNEEEALRVLKTVTSRESEASVEDTERLIKLAEKAADWDEAARLARRIVLLSGVNDVPASVRHADYLERAGRREEAENVWKALAARHARDPQVLSASGDFFERTGNSARAEDSYRAAARFRGCAPQVRLRLGQLALDRGDHSQALADFEMLLRETRQLLGSYKDCIPVPERIVQTPAPAVRSAGSRVVQWKVPLEADVEGCRLLAIREIGRLLAHSPRKKTWIEEFPEPVEKIWAAYYSGEETAAFLEIEKLALSADSAPALEQGFAALAMENSAEEALRRWVSDPKEAQAKWENILGALSRMLAANWLPSNDFLTRLFAPAPALVRWQAAEVLANRNLFAVASALGESVPDALPPSQACSAWIELSKWWIVLCNPDEAVIRLDKAIESAPSAISFGEPLFAAIRARWLLTPEDQKASFEEEVSARLRASKQPKCASAAAALISSLKGDHKGAGEKLAEVFQDLGNSDEESWSQLVQQGGNQVEDWNLHRLARELYRNDLARDSALLSLRGENFRDATINRFVLNQLIAADAEEVPYLLNEWLARGASDRELLDAVVRLQHGGRVQAAATVYRTLCERNPRNEGIRSGILNLIQVRRLQEAGIAFFERLLAEEYPGLGRAIIQTAGLRLAGVLDEEGDYTRALAILERLDRDGPLNKALLLRHVQALCKAGRHREALAELEKSPFLAASSEFTIPMAELYAGLGRERDAFTLLERDVRSGPPRRKAATAKLREMASLTGDEARLGVTESAPADDPPPGEKTPITERDWEKALTEIENPASSPEERFRALRNFLSVQRTLPEKLKTAQLARLRRMVAKNPGLLPEYYALRRELAERSGSTNSLLVELNSEWDAGRGPYQAGEMIVHILMQKARYEEVGTVLDDYLTETHFNERAWDQIGHRLLDARQYSLAARTFSELTQRAPGNLARSLLLAQALYWAGKATQADAMVSPIKRIAPFDPSKNVDIAEFYLATGRLAEARPYLNTAPSDARAGAAWIAAAELSVAQGDFAAARDCIRQAMKTPQVIPVRAIADFYWKSRALPRQDPRTNEFELGARQFRGLQMEVAQKLVEANDIERAWSWIESIRALLDDAQGRSLLQSVESSDWDRAAALWEASESPLWDTRCGMAQFFLRRAETGAQSPAAATKDLARAHELHPGSFEIAHAYVNKLLESDEQEAACKVLRQVIEAYSEPADRRAARQLLASLELAPALPKGD
jgi:thioredoxin-like negative regulator of GroEL